MKKSRLLIPVCGIFGLGAVGLTALGTAGCGSSGGGGGGGGTGDLNDATTIAVIGVTTKTDFATTGEFDVGFTATDADGNAVFSSLSVANSSLAVESGGWTTLKAQATAVSCTITTPTSTNCNEQTLTSTQPTGGSGNIAASAILDDSGSMSDSDPSNSRGGAANAFLDSICADSTNLFAVFDFGAGSTGAFTETRELLTADGGDTGGSISGTLPYIGCSSGNVTRAKTAVTNQVQASGDTPLYESVLEVCDDMVAAHASGGALDGRAMAILILSDGQPNSDINKTAAEDCIQNNSIAACTVGLGPGSELDASADTNAVDALKELSTAGSCVYAAATDAAALTPIFNTIGVAVSEGRNTATFRVSPIPTTGTAVEGSVTVGTATATFSFVAP